MITRTRGCRYNGIDVVFTTNKSPTSNKFYTFFSTHYPGSNTQNPHNMHEHPEGDEDGFIEYITARESEVNALKYAELVIDKGLHHRRP